MFFHPPKKKQAFLPKTALTVFGKIDIPGLSGHERLKTYPYYKKS
ncbi:hypothetical protein X474_02715 [Dethiosulfatarculus sandiegensis]|uniref:Uncharacterized protein n=1 Tax=Dethiosulfatarculus sandiegensis TaxID=1429043 RepID=A0A0D2JC53_9BACT|nr:hypothetical protein X474_02715 [Dethiosulfatarculus sandiegensis]